MQDDQRQFDFDFIVIGSGFGGSVSALRLTEKGYKVAVMEMGRRWTPDNLPKTNWSLARWFWRPGLGLRGFFSMRFFSRVTILHGCAVGGGSITYASTLLRAPDKVWDSGTWKGLSNWKSEMPRHYETASRMLGVTQNKILGPADHLLKQVAVASGAGETFYRTNVGIFQAPEGEAGGLTYADPYFGGEGPARTTCNACGGCMIGCRHGAKNTLDLNYLYLAEKRGMKIFAETRVVDVQPLGAVDGREGYEVTTERSTSFVFKNRQRFTCRGIVFSASSLGTTELLFRLKTKHSLPNISDQLGNRVRTNSESLIGVRVPKSEQDLSRGVAIGSGVYIDDHTHIEAVRYPKGSDVMGGLATTLTAGKPGIGRIALWFKNLLVSFCTHPVRTVRLLQPFGFARESVILLCMQALEGHIDMRWKRPWYWPVRRVLVSSGQRIPTFIPAANQFAQVFAKMAGGTAMSMLPEILFNIPATAHCLGGAVIGASPVDGVIDARHRVFGYTNMYVCDGSVVAANLGVNPSLTITALAERAMEFIPLASAHTWTDRADSIEVSKAV
ncbi:glucose-methanol-choline oxidoreductase [Candidatus Koribacter versatilis Ellin345]|uniref:Cholesterol oxidase n=1 Tax=Koribacter versatilis (strain Ellin345) TaxID=204669 RepID=Q1IUT4_KORVE|nr:GMC family oxidoreductase [Candidatus Koribacter versatilis]ABF39366.1 glucose-methanol-choline oxidoreductase [Candidatus Koribacter versatilis Ellin345]